MRSTALRAAVAKDSLSGEVYDEIGQLQLRRGEYRRAFTSFQQAAELAPAEAPVWNRLAQVALLQLGFEQEGLLALRYGQVADSTFSPLFYTQFVYHWARCEFSDAADAIAQARKHETEEGRALLWYSAQLSFEMTEGDFAKTANALRIHLVQADNDYSARIALVQAERGMDKPVDARNDAYGLLALDPGQPSWLIEAGLAQRALGQRDSALVFFDRAVRSDTSSFEALYDRTLTRLAMGDTASAFGEMHRLRRIDPGNWLTPLLASRVARAHGDTLRARLAFDEARRLNPALGLASAMRAGAAAAVPGWSSPELETAEKLIENGEFGLAGNKLYLAARDKERRAAALYWLSRVTRISGAPAGLPVLAAQAGAEASSGDPIFIRAPRRVAGRGRRHGARPREPARFAQGRARRPHRRRAPCRGRPQGRRRGRGARGVRRDGRRADALVPLRVDARRGALGRARRGRRDRPPARGGGGLPRAVRDLLAALGGALKGAVKDDCHGLATQIAYHWIYALFPGLFVLVGFLSMMGAHPGFLSAVGTLLERTTPGDTKMLLDATLNSMRQSLSHGTAPVLGFGLVGVMWVASNGFDVVMGGLNRAYGVAEHRPFWLRRLLAIVLVIGVGFGLVTGFEFIVVGSSLVKNALKTMPDAPSLPALYGWLRWPAYFTVAFFVALALYTIAPSLPARVVALDGAGRAPLCRAHDRARLRL